MNAKSDFDTSEFDQAPKSARSLLLEIYYGMLLGADRVKDAKRLHNAIIKHLSDEICLHEVPLPEHLRVEVADLEGCREQHSAAVVRLNTTGLGSDEAISSSDRFMLNRVPKSIRSLRFEQYYARLRDVHEIAEAMAVHTEIINELSAELYALETEPLPASFKVQAASEFERAQKQHAAALGGLTGILQRNEQLKWGS
jgi:hypothetical protein